MPVKTREAASKKSAARKATTPKRAAGSPRAKRKAATAGEELVTLDRRRGGRRTEEPAPVVVEAPPAPKLERRAKTQRRRQIDPTTCERDYSVEEVEFMNAMDDYKRKSGRMFPTCSEVLEVIRGMGYVKLSPTGRAMLTADTIADPMIDSDLVGTRN